MMPRINWHNFPAETTRSDLNSLVTDLSTSAAHRQRVFLEERLKVVKQDLDDASNQLAQFSSRNNTLRSEFARDRPIDFRRTSTKGFSGGAPQGGQARFG